MLSAVLAIVSLVGTAGTFYFGWKSSVLAKQRTHFSWNTIERAARTLAKRIDRQFEPEVILASQGGSAIFAHLLVFELGEQIPVEILKLLPEELPDGPDLGDDYEIMATSKWRFFIPKRYRSIEDRILIVADVATTGESLSRLVETLVEWGVPAENIRTAAAFCTQPAMDARRAPDFYWNVTSSDRLFLPWGPSQKLQRMGLSD